MAATGSAIPSRNTADLPELSGKTYFYDATHLAKPAIAPHENGMTKKTDDTSKSHTARNAAIGAAATIGSAAVAAALLYAGKHFKKKNDTSSIGSDQSDKAPSGEPPETD